MYEYAFGEDWRVELEHIEAEHNRYHINTSFCYILKVCTLYKLLIPTMIN